MNMCRSVTTFDTYWTVSKQLKSKKNVCYVNIATANEQVVYRISEAGQFIHSNQIETKHTQQGGGHTMQAWRKFNHCAVPGSPFFMAENTSAITGKQTLHTIITLQLPLLVTPL